VRHYTPQYTTTCDTEKKSEMFVTYHHRNGHAIRACFAGKVWRSCC